MLRILCFSGQTRQLAAVDMSVPVHTLASVIYVARIRLQIDRSRPWFESFPRHHFRDRGSVAILVTFDSVRNETP